MTIKIERSKKKKPEYSKNLFLIFVGCCGW